ncbi:MAG: alpha/beta fold hydrolase [Deltaproteobacteria bacterium]|nr:alpha/beta fold hydrolase [Deltaproteobacteria bacterium]
MTDKIKEKASWRPLYPFRSNYLDRSGMKYHYLDEGRGHPIVMVHGNPTWSFYYRSLILGLRDNYRTIVPDHLGCGLSDKPTTKTYGYRMADRVADLTALLDHLALNEPLTLIVHDWGGAIGMAWAVRHPERIRRLVVLNTAAFIPPVKRLIPGRLRLIRDVSFFAVPAVLGLNLFARAATIMAVRRKLSPPARCGLLAPYDSWPNRLATLKFVQDIPLKPGDPSYADIKFVEDRLGFLSALPMIICWGRHDFVFTVEYFSEWRRLFPGAEAHLLHEAGHYILEDAPDQVLSLVQAFLSRT